jgi:catechol 2,3-dioxygenase-like lactoylglutathione lyase family enzyme
MHVKVFGPCLLVEDVPASARFYIEHFGFQPRVELDWFTTLSHQDRPYEFAFIRADHETVSEDYRGRRTQGLIIGLLVPDAAAADARLRAAGVSVVLPLRDEPFGQRHVMVADPNGVLVDVVQPIPANPDWLSRQGLDHTGDMNPTAPSVGPTIEGVAMPIAHEHQSSVFDLGHCRPGAHAAGLLVLLALLTQ